MSNYRFPLIYSLTGWAIAAAAATLAFMFSNKNDGFIVFRESCLLLVNGLISARLPASQNQTDGQVPQKRS